MPWRFQGRQLLCELLPQATTVAPLVDLGTNADPHVEEVRRPLTHWHAPSLVKMMVRAHSWLAKLTSGEAGDEAEAVLDARDAGGVTFPGETSELTELGCRERRIAPLCTELP